MGEPLPQAEPSPLRQSLMAPSQWAEVERLRAELRQARQDAETNETLRAAWEKRAYEAEAEADRLYDVGRKFARHDADGMGWCGPVTCQCGLREAFGENKYAGSYEAHRSAEKAPASPASPVSGPQGGKE